jgi:hypothetical protein
MANEERLLTALTTEHFTLATARSTAVSESSARATIYLLSVSTTLVAIGFVSQLSASDDLFEVLTLTVLPTLFVLGLFTFLRLTEISVEDFRYGQAINRIRHYYVELAGERADYFLLAASRADTLWKRGATPARCRWRGGPRRSLRPGSGSPVLSARASVCCVVFPEV